MQPSITTMKSTTSNSSTCYGNNSSPRLLESSCGGGVRGKNFSLGTTATSPSSPTTSTTNKRNRSGSYNYRNNKRDHYSHQSRRTEATRARMDNNNNNNYSNRQRPRPETTTTTTTYDDNPRRGEDAASPPPYARHNNHNSKRKKNVGMPLKKRKWFHPEDRESLSRNETTNHNRCPPPNMYHSNGTDRRLTTTTTSYSSFGASTFANMDTHCQNTPHAQHQTVSRDFAANTSFRVDSKCNNEVANHHHSSVEESTACSPLLLPSYSSSPPTTEDDGSKFAVVSDAPIPDGLDSSTAASHSTFSVDGELHKTTTTKWAHHSQGTSTGMEPRIPAIPRQIETPTKSLLERELQAKIPKKKSKLPSSSSSLVANLGGPPPLKSSLNHVDSTSDSHHASLGEAARRDDVETSTTKLDAAAACATASIVKSTGESVHEETDLYDAPKSGTHDDEGNHLREELPERNSSSAPNLTDATPRKKKTLSSPSKLKVTNGATTVSSDKKASKISPSSPRLGDYYRVQIGARVSVYWDGEDAYFDGTVTKERPHKKKRYYVEYDDGDREWINLRKLQWRLLGGGKSDSEMAQESCARKNTTEVAAIRHVKGPQEKKVDPKPEQPSLKQDKRTDITVRESKKTKKSRQGFNPKDWMHDDEWVAKAAQKSESDSETDDEEVMRFARKMLGVEKAPLIARPKKKQIVEPEPLPTPDFYWEDLQASGIHIPISEKVKMGRRRMRAEETEEPSESERKRLKKKMKKRKRLLLLKESSGKVSSPDLFNKKPAKRAKLDCGGKLDEKSLLSRKVKSCTEDLIDKTISTPPASDENKEEENRRKKEEARTLTAEEVRAILGEDSDPCDSSSHWVRRSARMPSRSVLNTPKFKLLIEKLKTNDPDMVVLKMKKYLSDPDCPQVCIDTVLDALEENTNCQSLYIQNFNEGMRDKQVLRLLEILKKPSCNIWCLNIGETYKVKTRTWKAFTRGLKETKITHMYASEHTISSELKERIRATIRENRKKHNMHIDPENLDVIVKVCIEVAQLLVHAVFFSKSHSSASICSVHIVGGIQSMRRCCVHTCTGKDMLTF